MPPILEVLPLKRSQDHAVERRLIYLDQMVVTTIAKVRLGRELPDHQADPARELYDAVQRGVLERGNLLCVESWFHRGESSAIITAARTRGADETQALFDEISEFIQYYSRGLSVHDYQSQVEYQAVWAVALQLGLAEEAQRQRRWNSAFSDDPQDTSWWRTIDLGGDHPVHLGLQWEPRIMESPPWAEATTRFREQGLFPNFATTMEGIQRGLRGQRAHARRFNNEFSSWADRWGSAAFDDAMPRESMNAFIETDALFDLPANFVHRHLYAHVLSEQTRRYKDNDPDDIEILAAAIPCCDIVVTDTYMANAARQRGLDAAFGTTILPATAEGLRTAARLIDED